MSHSSAHIRSQRVIVPAIEKQAYCLCLHVKPTCITIGIVKLMRTLLFASIVLNEEFSVNDHLNDLSYSTSSLDERHRSTEAAVTILVLMLIASVSAMLIYGVIKERASYLMPFYAIQLCDFFFALPAFYNREPPSSLTDGLYDVKASQSSWLVSSNSNQPTRYSLLLFSTLIILVKIYFLCVVWKCYRYLRMKEMILPLHLAASGAIFPYVTDHSHHHHGAHHPGSGTSGGQSLVRVIDIIGPPPSSMAPPPYDSIVAASKAQPPPYEEAMKGIINPAMLSSANGPSSALAQTTQPVPPTPNFDSNTCTAPTLNQSQPPHTVSSDTNYVTVPEHVNSNENENQLNNSTFQASSNQPI